MRPFGLAEGRWEGNARETLSGFSDSIRTDFGFALFEMQQGKRPTVRSRRMESPGPGVYELKQADERGWRRLIYLARIGNAIHVLHCFKQHGQMRGHRDLRIAEERL